MKLISITLLVITCFNLSFAQTNRNYKQEFNDLIASTTNKDEYFNKISTFFNSMDDQELPMALAKISADKNTDFIAYELFAPNKNRFKKENFQKNMITQLKLKSNTPEFKMVLIDFLSNSDITDGKILNDYNKALFEIAKTNYYPESLRSYAASHTGVSTDYKLNKEEISTIFKSDNYAVINGAARSINKFLLSEDIPKAEKEYWSRLLINKAKEHYQNIGKTDQVIFSLGLTGSYEARELLLELFNDNKADNKTISETIAYSLSNIADIEVINAIFNAFSKYPQYDEFGSELTLKYIVNENIDQIDKLKSANNTESKVNFLRAVKLLNDNNRAKYINDVKQSLLSKSEEERLEAVKTLHFLLPYEKEKIIFKDFVINEKSDMVKTQISYYIGGIK
jgi:hypothetical protein